MARAKMTAKQALDHARWFLISRPAKQAWMKAVRLAVAEAIDADANLVADTGLKCSKRNGELREEGRLLMEVAAAIRARGGADRG